MVDHFWWACLDCRPNHLRDVARRPGRPLKACHPMTTKDGANPVDASRSWAGLGVCTMIWMYLYAQRHSGALGDALLKYLFISQ